MKKILLVALLAPLAGCSTVPADMSASVHPADNPAFTLRDARPKAESQSDMGSLSITNCNYGIRRLADTASIPDKVSILKDDLQDLAGQKLAGRIVTIKSYTVYFNDFLNLRAFVGRTQGGLIAHMMTNYGCKKEDVDGGWYDADEVTNSNSPLVADLQVEVDGKAYHSRAVESPDPAFTSYTGKDPNFTATLRNVLKKIATNLVTALDTAQP